MKKEYGSALKEFLKNRDYSEASKGLKALYGESKSWDKFLTEAKVLGFKWSQIYFVKEILEVYGVEDDLNLKWLLLHIQFQYELGNLRTSINGIEKGIREWLPPENSFTLTGVIESNPKLFGVQNQPFLLVKNYIYINRIKKYEEKFLELLDSRLSYNSDDDISDVVEKALKSNFLIISGGPGSGKTTTVVSIIKALKESGIESISLAAPTGRAAKRMIESIDSDLSVEAFTLHKLLGISPSRDKPRYNGERKLQTDVVIIDEASMVDIHMMYRLFDALKPETKLILVGDKDQLPSVEAGALLGDFLYNFRDENHKMHNRIKLLENSYRSTKGIMDGAKLVINGDVDRVIEYFNSGVDEINTLDLPSFDATVKILIDKYSAGEKIGTFNVPLSRYMDVIDQIESAFRLYSSFMVLTPSKKGLYGTYSLNAMIKRAINHIEPIMINRNDYINGLFNGDRGVIFSFTNGSYAFFKESDGYKIISISKLTDYETAYVGTVHKSQGSEYDRVSIIIPEGSEKLLTREILYTALTRAKKHVTLLAMENEIRTAVGRKIERESGIRDFLLDKNS